MMKPSPAVLVSILLLATLAAAGASLSSPPSSLGKHPVLVRELGQLSGNHHQHQSKHMQMQEPEEVAMEVKKPEEDEEAKAPWTADQGEDDAEAGLIYSADYSSVAMHAGSPPTAKPKHRHPATTP